MSFVHARRGAHQVRGVSCWRDLTCRFYHYETQPLPNPLSRWLHFRPHWLQKLGVAFNHVAELLAPWFVVWPRVARLAAGGIMLAFQVTLIASGNLSFLNWLTIVPILACFDDGLLRHVGEWLPPLSADDPRLLRFLRVTAGSRAARTSAAQGRDFAGLAARSGR